MVFACKLSGLCCVSYRAIYIELTRYYVSTTTPSFKVTTVFYTQVIQLLDAEYTMVLTHKLSRYVYINLLRSKLPGGIVHELLILWFVYYHGTYT